jgi:hypothetical protein
MSGKDEYIFNKFNLVKTTSGKKILKKGILKDKGYLQFKKYNDISKNEFVAFVSRFQNGVYNLIKKDLNPTKTHDEFIAEIGNAENLRLNSTEFESFRNKFSDIDQLSLRIKKILNSNFVKMTFPVFNALFDGYVDFKKDSSLVNIRTPLIDGHLIAIDLSEPMDRIVDKDEDIEFLDDYKFINPYLLLLAKQNLAELGENVVSTFEHGFRDALLGQMIDYEMKMDLREMTYDNLEQSYRKYRSVLGTAGKNMCLSERPLSEIYYIGMAKAAECVGCGNEIQDAIANNGIKSPSWPLYYSLNTNSVKKGFELALEKSHSYLSEANLALNMLDDRFMIKPFLDFLFLTVSHYNEFWYHELFTNRADLLTKFQKDLVN